MLLPGVKKYRNNRRKEKIGFLVALWGKSRIIFIDLIIGNLRELSKKDRIFGN